MSNTAKRPLIMAALKTVMINGVALVASRCYLPWDNRPTMEDVRETGPILLIEVVDGSIDDTESIGQWMHTVKINVGGVKAGTFDYPTTWELLQQASQALLASGTLGGLAQRIDVTGTSDHIAHFC